MNIVEIAWLAGLLEGEGCFYIFKGKGATPKITLSMTDEDVLARAALLMDAPYRALKLRAGCKQNFRTEVHAEKAMSIMRRVLPYMGSRRTAKIVEVLDAADSRSKIAFGEKHGIARFSNKEVRLIRSEYEAGPKSCSQSRLARKYGVPIRTMHGVLSGKTYSKIDQ